MKLNPIHQTEAMKLAESSNQSATLLGSANQKLDEVKQAIKEISITKEIKIDFSETNDLLKKLAEREDEPVEVSVKLNII